MWILRLRSRLNTTTTKNVSGAKPVEFAVSEQKFSEDVTQTRLDGQKPLRYFVGGTMRATQNCDPRGMQMSAN
jgi:hypothetical protein